VKKVPFAAALVAAALVVPAASASHAHRVKLSIVVLPKSALGAAGHSLAVSRDNSGIVSNAQASNDSFAGKASTFSKLGRITGYGLSYGDPYSGGAGVTLIATGVDQYKSSADAKRGLAFWQKDDPKIAALAAYGLPLTVKAVKAAKVGTRRFAEGSTYGVPGAAPAALVDEQFTDGRYVLKVDVAAASLSAATRLADRLARPLDHRLRLAEAGHLRGKPVKLPPRLEAGPPAGGPDLATLALTAADLGGQATLGDHTYSIPESPALSDYELDYDPAGSFTDLTQNIDWFPTANDATVIARVEGAGLAYLFAAGLLGTPPGQFTPVDLRAVGDGAYGGIVTIAQAGRPTIYVVVVALSSGRASDVVLAASDSQVQAADVVNLAQVAANRLNAGLAG
jgi:hypothetical protein